MDRMTEPLISVLIPAYLAEAEVTACLRSLITGENATVPAEFLVESDDATPYAAAAALSARVKVGVTGLTRTGVGAARNRALARATAPFIAYVDADDTVSPDYLPRLLALARPNGAAAAMTQMLEAGREVARFGTPGFSLDFEGLARHGASYRGLIHRDLFPAFENDLSQDILHMAEVLLHAGPVPVADATYALNLAQGTVTAADDFSDRVDQAYLRHIDRLATRHPGHADLPAAQALFHAKRALNRRFMAEGRPGESYYAFIARVMPAWMPSRS
jgi:glycosyltransferase involved in cell wall biosynthesis